jgi:SAM-dependent methyltransferase
MLRILTDPQGYKEKEDLYLAVRRKEERVVSVSQIRLLPDTPSGTPHADEWLIRKRSYQRLHRYLHSRFSSPETSILDVGCGNGWMTNALSQNGRFNATGIDLNMTELALADEAFSGSPRVQFAYGDILGGALSGRTFDAIVVASSCQYFSNLAELMGALRDLLQPGGEIHVIDTPFYMDDKIPQARERSRAYYHLLGYPDMANCYFHHRHSEMRRLGGVDLNAKGIPFLAKLLQRPQFPWFKISREVSSDG